MEDLKIGSVIQSNISNKKSIVVVFSKNGMIMFREEGFSKSITSTGRQMDDTKWRLSPKSFQESVDKDLYKIISI